MEPGSPDKDYRIGPLAPEHITDMYLAFKNAFTDYPMPVQMSLNQFHYKFIVRLGLDYSCSAGCWTEDHLAAFLFTTLDTFGGERIAYHGCVGVRVNHRGNQLIAGLYNYQKKLLTKAGIHCTLLEVLSANQRALNLYDHLGFKITRRLITFERIRRTRTRVLNEIRTVNSIPWDVISSWPEDLPSFMNSRSVIDRSMMYETILVAELDKEIRGILIFDEYNGRISKLSVHPDHRRQGIGTALLEAAESKIESDTTAFVNIPSTNVTAQLFLRKTGFREVYEQLEMKQYF